MSETVEIENIEEMRKREGIDDVELREQIRRLKIGDLVRLTLLTGAKSSGGETLSVRITFIRGAVFRGELAVRPTSSGLSKMRVGSCVNFTRDHIHSVSGSNHGRDA